jgi:hypothetical protein
LSFIEIENMAEGVEFIPLKIGIDFGGVLVVSDKHYAHHTIEINIPNAIESLIKLKEASHQLYLISYCGKRRAIEIKRSLLRILPRNDLFNGLYFVQKKSHKADVCRALGCDIMIDDTLKILNNIHHLIPTMKLLWFALPNTNIRQTDIIKVESWFDIIKTIDEVLIDQAIRHQANSRILLNDKLHDV